MKIGIISDIHGNIYAFEKVWNALKKELCDIYFCLGDICGYYFNQNEIIEVLKEEKNLISILGNHDHIFLRMLKDAHIEEEYTKEHGKSCKLLKETIEADNLNYLEGLPQEKIIDEYKIALFHGNPWDHLNGYSYPTDSLSRYQGLPHNLILLGHTHYPMDKTIGNVRIVNPGACGQPRDFNSASYAVVNLENSKVDFKRVDYDTDSLIRDIKRRSEKNSYLTEVLLRKNE